MTPLDRLNPRNSPWPYGPGRVYLSVIVLLALALIALVALYASGAADRLLAPTKAAVSGAGVMTFLYEIEAPAGTPFRPRGAAIADRKAYVADSEGGRVAVLDLDGGPDGQLAFIPVAPELAGEQLGPAQPGGVGVLPDGTLLVSDIANARIWRYSPEGSFLGDFLSAQERERSHLSAPLGISVGEGEVLVTDVEDQTVKVFAPGGRFLRQLGEGGFRPGQLSFPNAVAVGNDRRVFVADSNNRRVQVLSPTGEPLGVIDQAADAEGLRLPRGLALDRLGRLHVVDTFGQAVFIYRDGTYEAAYGRGLGEEQLSLPEGIAAGEDRIVISDGGNRRLLVYAY